MNTDLAKPIITNILQQAGITINGKNPWDIHIHQEQFYRRVLQDKDLGLGESYMEGWWDCQRIDLFIAKLCDANIESRLKNNVRFLLKMLIAKFFSLQTKSRAFIVGKKHYDLGNELFQTMLDRRMNYSCGYWKNAKNLELAQQAKLELICKKLLLKPGMRVLDIGCGWGGFAKYAAENFGVDVVGITISQQQCSLAQERCKDLPIEIRFQDYRDVHEQFDRVVSIGMFEHVGHLNYRVYMQMVHDCLADDGLFLLHTIGNNETITHASPWISKYIFPNGMLPSIMQIGKAIETLFVMEDWHNFGLDYYQTLLAWQKNFNQGWDKIKDNYDDHFFRMWNYYLLYSAGGFKARALQVWQIVLSKKGLRERYEATR